MKFEEEYKKDHWEYNEEFGPVHEFVIDLLIKKIVPLKEIRFGFSYHYCKIDCKEGIKIYWRFDKKRMNNPKLILKVKNFEIEAEQGAWDTITIRRKEIEVETNNGSIYFVFQKPIVEIFKKKLNSKGQTVKEKEQI